MKALSLCYLFCKYVHTVDNTQIHMLIVTGQLLGSVDTNELIPYNTLQAYNCAILSHTYQVANYGYPKTTDYCCMCSNKFEATSQLPMLQKEPWIIILQSSRRGSYGREGLFREIRQARTHQFINIAYETSRCAYTFLS